MRCLGALGHSVPQQPIDFLALALGILADKVALRPFAAIKRDKIQIWIGLRVRESVRA